MKQKCLSLLGWLRRRPLPVLCYGAALLGFLIWCVGCLLADALGTATGRLQTREMQVSDFALVNLEMQADGGLFTLTDDPQMILADVSGFTVRSLTIRADYTKDAREMCLYYTTRKGADFSQEQRVFAVQADDGSCTYTLPRQKIYALRLDPCSPAQNELLTMTVHEITLNRPEALWQYFAPGWYGAFCLVLYPGMAAAALCILREGVLGLAAVLKRKKPAA